MITQEEVQRATNHISIGCEKLGYPLSDTQLLALSCGLFGILSAKETELLGKLMNKQKQIEAAAAMLIWLNENE